MSSLWFVLVEILVSFKQVLLSSLTIQPELAKGVIKQMVEQGKKAILEKLISIGFDAGIFVTDTGDTDLSKLAKQLNENRYDGIVIGNGIRSQASNFILFEQIINVVHANAPASKIIFNTLPQTQMKP